MPRLYRVLVPVKDIDQAQSFYEAVLEIEGSRVSPGRHNFDCDGTILACYDPIADGESRTPKPNPEDIFIAVSDLAGTYARCEARGATFLKRQVDGLSLGDIELRATGERSFYARDPFGNHICFVDEDTVSTDS